MSEKTSPVATVQNVVLLPCTHCGCDPAGGATYNETDDCWEIACSNCGSVMMGSTEQRVVVGWQNRRVTGLVNWLVAEMEKAGETSYMDKRYQTLRDCRKMVKRLLGQ